MSTRSQISKKLMYLLNVLLEIILYLNFLVNIARIESFGIHLHIRLFHHQVNE